MEKIIFPKDIFDEIKKDADKCNITQRIVDAMKKQEEDVKNNYGLAFYDSGFNGAAQQAFIDEARAQYPGVHWF